MLWKSRTRITGEENPQISQISQSGKGAGAGVQGRASLHLDPCTLLSLS